MSTTHYLTLLFCLTFVVLLTFGRTSHAGEAEEPRQLKYAEFSRSKVPVSQLGLTSSIPTKAVYTSKGRLLGVDDEEYEMGANEDDDDDDQYVDDEYDGSVPEVVTTANRWLEESSDMTMSVAGRLLGVDDEEYEIGANEDDDDDQYVDDEYDGSVPEVVTTANRWLEESSDMTMSVAEAAAESEDDEEGFDLSSNDRLSNDRRQLKATRMIPSKTVYRPVVTKKQVYRPVVAAKTVYTPVATSTKGRWLGESNEDNSAAEDEVDGEEDEMYHWGRELKEYVAAPSKAVYRPVVTKQVYRSVVPKRVVPVSAKKGRWLEEADDSADMTEVDIEDEEEIDETIETRELKEFVPSKKTYRPVVTKQVYRPVTAVVKKAVVPVIESKAIYTSIAKKGRFLIDDEGAEEEEGTEEGTEREERRDSNNEDSSEKNDEEVRILKEYAPATTTTKRVYRAVPTKTVYRPVTVKAAVPVSTKKVRWLGESEMTTFEDEYEEEEMTKNVAAIEESDGDEMSTAVESSIDEDEEENAADVRELKVTARVIPVTRKVYRPVTKAAVYQPVVSKGYYETIPSFQGVRYMQAEESSTEPITDEKTSSIFPSSEKLWSYVKNYLPKSN